MYELVGTRRGTIPHKILTMIDGEMSQAEIAEMIGADRDNISGSLHKLLVGKKLDRRRVNNKYYYRLAGTPETGIQKKARKKKEWSCLDCGTTENKANGRNLCKSCLTDDRKNGGIKPNKLSLEWLSKPIRVAA